MRILAQPTEFIRDELGADVTLLYGDMRGRKRVVYALRQLEGYEPSGDGAFFRELDISDPLTRRNMHLLEEAISRPIPREYYYKIVGDNGGAVVWHKTRVRKPRKFEIEKMGIRGSYGFVPSPEFLENVDLTHYLFSAMYDPFCLSKPGDVTLAHEGAHLGMSPHERRIFPKFRSLMNGSMHEYERIQALAEATAILEELNYLRRFHQEEEGNYHNWRADKSQGERHRRGYSLAVQEPNAVAEMIAIARDLNLTVNRTTQTLR